MLGPAAIETDSVKETIADDIGDRTKTNKGLDIREDR